MMKNILGKGLRDIPAPDVANEKYWETVWRRFKKHKLAMIGIVTVAVILLLALLVPMLSPYDPNKSLNVFNEAPSLLHPLGTDQVGRDVMTRLFSAVRISLLVGLMATGISTVIGVLLGLVSGFFGGWVDMLIMRITDIIMSFPYILLVLVAAAVFEPGLWNIILILGFVDWPGIARLVRGSVLSLRETNFVKASEVAGMSKAHILFKEILPNTVAPILIYTTSVLALSILDEAALSFIGMGVQAPTASLGNMLNNAQNLTILTSRPWLWIPPGVMIILLVVAINFVGDALRDAMDPTSGK
ncbi:MAG: ABC transporter permease [Clostridia bacterium]|nr:ABC transporter permease [Clostridia bacterium]